jgi:hypothetical protein
MEELLLSKRSSRMRHHSYSGAILTGAPAFLLNGTLLEKCVLALAA